MALPTFTMKQLMEAGVHFGHHTRRWNPLMTPYVYGVKDKIHIINLNKTAPLLHRSLVALEAIAAAGGKVLFVATKHQAKDIVKDAAERCGQYYVNNRWLGGMLTNWTTVSQSIRRLKKMEADIANAEKLGLTKKEVGVMTKEVEKLRDIFGGIMEMHGTPQAMVVIDVPREMNAVREAKNLDIPTIAICDAILSSIEKRLGGAAGKKVESDMRADAADDLEDDIKAKEAKIKSKTSEARAERRSKLADKADK